MSTTLGRWTGSGDRWKFLGMVTRAKIAGWTRSMASSRNLGSLTMSVLSVRDQDPRLEGRTGERSRKV